MHLSVGYQSIGHPELSDEAFGVYEHNGLHLAAVCDAGGLHGGGHETAQLVLRTLAEAIVEPTPDLRGFLREAVQLANRLVFDGGRRRPSAVGHSASIAAVAVSDGLAVVGHVGNARAYLVRDGKVQSLTRDHTMANLIADASPEPPQAHSDAHIDALTRALGRDRDVQPELRGPITLRDGDVFVLGSSGMWSALSELDLRAAADLAAPSGVVQLMRDVAKRDADAPATVIMLRVGAQPGASQELTEAPIVERPGDLLTPSTADLQLMHLPEQPYDELAGLTAPARPSVVVPEPRPGPSRERSPSGSDPMRQLVLQILLVVAVVIATLLIASLFIS